jgi:hypothetical protein
MLKDRIETKKSIKNDTKKQLKLTHQTRGLIHELGITS